MSLIKKISWTFWGNIIYSICQWGILISIAKILNAESVGIFSIALAITAPIFAFTNFQLREIQATDVFDNYSFEEYVGFRIASSTCAFVAIFFIALLLYDDLYKSSVIIVVGLAKYFESLSDVIYGMLQKHESMEYIAFSLIIKGIFSLCAFAISIYITSSVLFASVSLLAVWASSLVLVDVGLVKNLIKHKKIAQSVKPVFKKKVLLSLFWLASPMGLVILLGSLNMNIPRYILEAQLGAKALGYFSAILYIVVAGNTIVGAVGQVATPRLARLFSNDLSGFKKLMIKVAFLAFLVGVVGIFVSYFFGSEILSIVYSRDYADYSDVFVLTMVLAMIFYISSMIGRGLTSARSFLTQAIIAPVTTVTISLAAFYLIPIYGLFGSIYSLIIGFFIKMIMEIIVLLKLYHNKSISVSPIR